MTLTLVEAFGDLPPQVRDEVAAVYTQNEFLSESLADAQLALEDRGWTKIGDKLDELNRDGLRAAAKTARALAVTNALARRGVALRIAYIWGSGVQFTAADPDINTLVQDFIDDEGNRRALFGEQAREENERGLATDGNRIICCVTAPRTGRVQVRTIPFDEVTEVISNPDDKDDPWFYRRVWNQTVLKPSARGVVKTSQRMEAYYPALGYRPATRARTFDGNPIHWDKPVRHVSVNRLDGWDFGIGDLYTAMPWARAYSEFLRDWALLMKSLSKIAWRATARGSKAQQAASKIRTALGPDGVAGQAAVGSEDVRLEAVSKSGATLDSESGRPLAAMVAAALDVPVTMLLGDPGTTGARATAETLDKPMELGMGMRRARWVEVFRDIFDHVVREAVRAPQGPLKGRVVRDQDGREGVVLVPVDGEDRDVSVTTVFPPLEDVDVPALVKAVVDADGTGKLPPLVVARKLLEALGVEDVDAALGDLQDEDGNFVDPLLAAAGRREEAVQRSMVPAPDDQLVPDSAAAES